MNSPRFDLRTIFAQKFNRNLTLLPISKNGLDVGLELVPIFDEFGQPYAYRNGYSGTYPTSPNDTLLPSGHFVSGNTDSAGFAYLSVLAHEKFGPGQRLSDVKLSVGYSFDVFQSNQDPLFEIVNSNVSYSFVDTSLIRIDVSRGQQVDLRIRGSVRLDSAAGPTPISANLSSQSISSLSIPQPSLQPIRTFGTLSGQDTVEFDFSWLVPTGLPVGRHRMIANITDENCPINGMTSRIIEFVNDGNYMFKYSLCQGDSIQLIAPVNANLYSWYPQSNISNSTSSQPFVFPTGHTVYKLIADGDTVATYNILIDKTVKPSVTLNSNNQVELMNPQDYSTHQMFFFYYPMAKDDTFYTPSEAGLYHISGGQSNCIQYSDSLEYRPTILQSVSMMDDFMDESMLTSLGPNDYLRVVTHFNGSQYPTRLTKLIIPGGYISPGSSVELVYNNTNIPSVTIYPQPGPHNSLEFNLNPPLRAVDTGATFQFNVLTGTLLLPVRYSSTELSHPKITRVYSLLHFDQSADRTYPQVPLVFQGTGPVSLDEHESLFSIYPQPADQFLEIEGVD
ncbi:MAG: hypothetical protein HWE24_16815, partial [Oceanospirillaceae bacterium]|nr:hypothetical protein [Oceanospirillaceae bacterium]